METPTATGDGSPSSRPENELVTIAGGIELEVAHLDGSKETVKVREIPISQIQKFASLLAKEDELIEFYCDKPKGWTGTLTVESANAVADKGLEINLPFFGAWRRRQAMLTEALVPGAVAQQTKAIEAVLKQALASASSPPPSPTATD